MLKGLVEVRFIFVIGVIVIFGALGAFAENDIVKKKIKGNQAAELMAQVDLLTKSMPEKPAHNGSDDDWQAYHKARYIIQADRIELLEALEEMALPEDQIKHYAELLISDIKDCIKYTQWLGNKAHNLYWNKLSTAVFERSPLVKVLAEELFWEMNIHYVNTHLMSISQKDMQKIADFEIDRKDVPEAGRLLAKAIYLGHPTKEMEIKWKTWILGNMGEESEGYQTVIAKSRRKSGLGKPFTFESKDLNGNTITSKDYLGKVVLIDYWALWCGFCLREIPEIKKLKVKYYDKGLLVVGVFNDCRFDALKEYVKENSINWPQLIEPTATEIISMHPLANKYGITALPRYMLIDKEGKLVKMAIRVEHLESKIEALLQNKD